MKLFTVDLYSVDDLGDMGFSACGRDQISLINGYGASRHFAIVPAYMVVGIPMVCAFSVEHFGRYSHHERALVRINLHG